jgi:signal transduction histidine kinase
LLDDILDYSRLETRRVTLLPQTVKLDAWARQTVDMVRWRAERKALALLLDVPELPSMLVLIDPVRVRQIVLNLLVNAINFTARGRYVARGLSRRPSWTPRFLDSEVRDTGIGIGPDRRRPHLRTILAS